MMTEKAMRCVRALRICHSNEDCRDCEFVESDRDEKSCVNVLFEDAADLIQSLSEQLEAAQPKWISVEERLPDFERRVLVVNGHGKVFTLAFWRKVENRWSWIDESGHFKHYNDITHWMNLPEAPKEE